MKIAATAEIAITAIFPKVSGWDRETMSLKSKEFIKAKF